MPEKHTTNPNLDLLDCALKQGVPAIGRYLQHATGHVLHITTLQGCECYPRAGHILTAAELEIFRNIPSFTDQEYFYDKNHQQLTLRCSLSEDDGLLLSFATVTPADIPALVEQAAPAHLALLWYLRSQMTAQAQADRSLDTLLARVFQGNDVRVDALLSRHGLQLSPDQNYAVMVMQLPQDTTITLPELAQQMQEFCTEHSLPVIQPLTWQGMHLAILSGFYRQTEYRGLTQRASRELVSSWHQAVEEKCGVALSLGIGGEYPLDDLHHSLREARIALTFHTIKGKQGFVQWFDELGIFCELFRCPPARIHTFCRQTLDKLLEYDHDCNADLQITLRTLLDDNFNYKATAEKLFIHVNTVRYRAEKIAQLLNIDLNDPDTRFNLYAALRVGDVRKALDLLQPGYIGTIHSPHAKSSKTVF